MLLLTSDLWSRSAASTQSWRRSDHCVAFNLPSLSLRREPGEEFGEGAHERGGDLIFGLSTKGTKCFLDIFSV